MSEPKSFHHRSVGITSMFCCSPAITLACMYPMLNMSLIYSMIGLGTIGSAGMCYASDYKVSVCFNPCFWLNICHEKK